MLYDIALYILTPTSTYKKWYTLYVAQCLPHPGETPYAPTYKVLGTIACTHSD